VDSKAEFDQLNLAHETKTNKRQWALRLVQYRFKICESRPEGISRICERDE